MSLPNLIGVTGFKRSGKDTFANVLVEHGYMRLAFADELKKEVAGFLGISTEELEHDKSRWREVLQYHGCAIREMTPNYWIYMLAALRDAMYARDLLSFFVISDVRFKNEADWIHSKGGVIVRMVRDGVFDADPSWHVSEREVVELDADYTLDANTIEGRQQGARDLIESWKK